MCIRTQVIRANEFVRTTPLGELDFERTKQMLKQAVEATENKLFCDIILDLREATGSLLTPTDVYNLAIFLQGHPSLYLRKMALLLPPDAPGIMAHQFQVRANSLGFQVQTFKDFERAVYWLSSIEKVGSKDLD